MYPWIFEFNRLSVVTNADEINKELEKRTDKKHTSCGDQLFDTIDESKFRKELSIEKCKQFILWANIGFANEILEDIRTTATNEINSQTILQKLDEHFDELRKVFYTSIND